MVVEAVYKHNSKNVVIHSLSNNGAVLYQHLTQLVATQYKDITIQVEHMVRMLPYNIYCLRELYLTLPQALAHSWSTYQSHCPPNSTH